LQEARSSNIPARSISSLAFGMGHLNADVTSLSNKNMGKLLLPGRLTHFQIIVWLEFELRTAKLISTTEDQVTG
jgi:hypothetical protein